MVLRKALLLLLLLPGDLANFLSEPAIQWSYTLPITDSVQEIRLQKGNAVVASQDDELLFITTQDASLFVLETKTGLPTADPYQPPAVPGAVTSCQSGVTLAQDETGVQYAVYAVVDAPDPDDAFNSFGETNQSRMIALNANGSERWTVVLDGSVIGTPAIGMDRDTIYVSHNVPNVVDNGEQYRGQVTVLRDNGGSPITLAEILLEDRFGPFGPLTVKTATTNGNSNEVVFVAESWGGGYEYNGNVYYLDASTGQYSLKIFSEWGYSSIAAPTVSDNADMLWIAGVGSTVGAWMSESYASALTSGAPADPNWQSIFVQSGEVNVTMDISPVVSTDNSLLFITGESDEVYCVEANTGRLQWAYDGGDRGYAAKPIYRSRDGEDGVLYTASIPTGTVKQLDSLRGRENWSYGCEDLTGETDCQNSIQADFSVSSGDNMLYYGSVDGTIVALQVGAFPTPAPASVPPTPTPTITEPSAPDSLPVPTASPTGLPTNSGAFNNPFNNGNVSESSESPTAGLNDTTTKALFVVSALVAALAIGILAYVFVSVKRRRLRKDSGLPVMNQLDQNNGGGNGGADTGIPAESPLETIGGSVKRKKKKRSVSTSSETSSPSRLGAIDESSLEDASLEGGHELPHDDEEEDVENYVFDYTETTPDTSFSSSQFSSVSPERVTQSPDVAYVTNSVSKRAASEQTAMSPRLVAVTEKAVPPADGVNRPISPATESDCNSTDDEILAEHPYHIGSERELIPAASNGPRAYYMLDTRPEGAGSIIKIANRSDAYTNGRNPMPNESQQVHDVPLSGGTKNGSPHVVADSSAVVSVNRGARSSYALDHGISAAPSSLVQSTIASTSANIVNEKQMGLRGVMVPLSEGENRPAYEIGRPAVGMNSWHRSIATASSTVHAQDTQDKHQKQEITETLSKEHVKLLQKPRSIKSDGTKTLASIDEDATPAKQSALVPVSEPRSAYVVGSEKEQVHYFEDQLSPCNSMYLDEESTAATGVTGEGTLDSAPLDERASRSYIARSKLSPTSQRMYVSPPGDFASTLGTTPKRLNVSSPPVAPSSARLDVISPLTVEKSDTQSMASKKSPFYLFQAPMSPGSTIGSTSIYIDEEGSVEMEPDDRSNASVPVDEKDTAPASVLLNACSTPKKNEEMFMEPTKEIKKIGTRKSYGNPNKARLSSTSAYNKHPSSTEVGKRYSFGAPKLSPPPPLSPASTSTNDSKSSAESAHELGRPPAETSETIRQMRKMRLERTIRGRKADGARSQKEGSPMSVKQIQSAGTTKGRREIPLQPSVPIKRQLQSATEHKRQLQSSAEHPIINDGQSHTTGDNTIAPSSQSIDSIECALLTDSDSDTSSEKRPPPPVKKNYSRREQPRRSSLTSDARKIERKESVRHARAPRKSKRHHYKPAARQSKAEGKRKGSAQPAVITSYLSGIIKHVEEAEHRFFNPTLTPPKKSKKTTSQKIDLSDDDSLPPPRPPSHL